MPKWEDFKQALYDLDEGFAPSLVDLMTIPEGGPYPVQIDEDEEAVYWKVTVEINVGLVKPQPDEDED